MTDIERPPYKAFISEEEIVDYAGKLQIEEEKLKSNYLSPVFRTCLDFKKEFVRTQNKSGRKQTRKDLRAIRRAYSKFRTLIVQFAKDAEDNLRNSEALDAAEDHYAAQIATAHLDDNAASYQPTDPPWLQPSDLAPNVAALHSLAGIVDAIDPALAAAEEYIDGSIQKTFTDQFWQDHDAEYAVLRWLSLTNTNQGNILCNLPHGRDWSQRFIIDCLTRLWGPTPPKSQRVLNIHRKAISRISEKIDAAGSEELLEPQLQQLISEQFPDLDSNSKVLLALWHDHDVGFSRKLQAFARPHSSNAWTRGLAAEGRRHWPIEPTDELSKLMQKMYQSLTQFRDEDFR